MKRYKSLVPLSSLDSSVKNGTNVWLLSFILFIWFCLLKREKSFVPLEPFVPFLRCFTQSKLLVILVHLFFVDPFVDTEQKLGFICHACILGSVCF